MRGHAAKKIGGCWSLRVWMVAGVGAGACERIMGVGVGNFGEDCGRAARCIFFLISMICFHIKVCISVTGIPPGCVAQLFLYEEEVDGRKTWMRTR